MEKTITNDIVITSLQSWNTQIGSNSKNLALEFSKNNRVLFVNPPLHRLHAIKSKIRKHHHHLSGLFEISKNLWVLYPAKIIESISQLPNNRLFDLLNHRNNQLFASEIRAAMEKIGFKSHIHLCDNDMFGSFYLKDYLNPRLFIYYTRDNLRAINYWKTQGHRIEPHLMKKADLVIANSPYLAQIAKQYNPNSHFVGQGCNVSAFSINSYQKSDYVASIAKPTIGYIGSLNSLRLDIGIIEHIATHRPEWDIVLVGPEDETFKRSSLHRFRNVYFLGARKESEFPFYLQYFDVAIHPQMINEVTAGKYPKRINEYLAMGKPVVATRTSTMEYFSEFVALADHPKEWVSLIQRELNDQNKEIIAQRKTFAQHHTWENNVNEIFKHIHQAAPQISYQN